MKKLVILLIAIATISIQIQAQPLAKHVILIGLDGWAAHDFDKVRHNIPDIRSLIENESCKMHKRSVLPSDSGVNWASMFMGAGPEMHGYTTWNSKKHDLVSSITNKNGIFPTIFSIIREQYPNAETGCTFEWDGIKYVIDTLAISHVHFFTEGWEPVEKNCDHIVKYITESKPMFYAACFDGPDGPGHKYGWYSDGYYEYLARVDKCVGRIIQDLKDAGIYDDTIIVVTGDHGGHDHGHGSLAMEDMESPLLFFGRNVRSGYTYTDPIAQYDVAASIAYILDLKMPEAWRGKPVKQVFIR